MKKINLLIIVSATLLVAACQSTPHQYNGVTGYEIENKTTTSATRAYTLAARGNRNMNEKKL